MSETGDRTVRDRERERLKAFWEGDRETPFVMERARLDCDCDVLLPTLWSRVQLVLRSIILAISRMVPTSGLKSTILRLTGMRIGRDVTVSPGAVIDPLWPDLIEIADGAVLGLGCRVLTHECTAEHFRIGKVHIGKGAVVGAGSTVRAGVRIGQRATVGCNSYVNDDVPEGATVGGVPARILKTSGERAG